MSAARVALAFAVVAAGCSGRPKPAPPTTTPRATTSPTTSRTKAPPRKTALASPASAMVPPADFERILARRKAQLMAAGRRVRRDEAGYYMDVQEARLRQVGGADLRVTRHEWTLVLEIAGPVAFEAGSAQLSARTIAVLTNVMKVLDDYRFSVISVHGHTDDSGDAAQNQALSEQRALVVTQLITDVVTPDRMLAVGHGATLPLAPNNTPADREQNRRIELQVDLLVP